MKLNRSRLRKLILKEINLIKESPYTISSKSKTISALIDKLQIGGGEEGQADKERTGKKNAILAAIDRIVAQCEAESDNESVVLTGGNQKGIVRFKVKRTPITITIDIDDASIDFF